MSTKSLISSLVGAVAAIALLPAPASQAQSVAEFYKGRQMNIIVASDSGSTYDNYARFLSRHMSKHIPGNPSFVVQNMPGAGQLKGTEYIYRIAPKDGTVFGTISRGFPFDPMLGENPLKIDPLKFTWLGSMNREVSLAISWHTSKIKTLADLMNNELIVAGTGAAADSEIMPKAFNNLAGTKFKIVSGYRGLVGGSLAMERGEVEGIAYWSWSAVRRKEDWLREKKINLIFHTGPNEHPELKGVPRIRAEIKDETGRKAMAFLLDRELLGRPFVAPPDLPADRANALKAAFAATLNDADFKAEGEKRKIETDLVRGDEIAKLLQNAALAPKEVIDRVKQALNRK